GTPASPRTLCRAGCPLDVRAAHASHGWRRWCGCRARSRGFCRRRRGINCRTADRENNAAYLQRLMRSFFERIIEWDWDDSPARNPAIAGDIPKKPEPLPRFLDDVRAPRFMAAARASTDPRDRLVVELLA